MSDKLIQLSDLLQGNATTVVVIDVSEPEELTHVFETKNTCPPQSSYKFHEGFGSEPALIDQLNYLKNIGKSETMHADVIGLSPDKAGLPYTCSVCSLYFESFTSYSGHAKACHFSFKNDIFSCKLCDYFSKSKYMAEKHFLDHINEQPFRCQVCSKCFHQKASMVQHMRTHSKTRPFACHLCTEKYKTISSLNIHVSITHAKMKPYTCMDCGLCFGHLSNLRIHMRTHTGERPYVCQFCGKSFVQLGHLQTHSRLHTGERPFKCQYCGSLFTHVGNLRQHEITQHTKDYKHRCQDCSKGFIGPSELKRHILASHTLPDETPTISTLQSPPSHSITE